MSEIADRYGRLADEFATAVAAVPDDRWSSPSPCEGWTARDVVEHVCDTQALFLGFVDEPAGEGPSVADDPAGAWRAAAAPVRAVLADPQRASATFDGLFGETSFESAVDRSRTSISSCTGGISPARPAATTPSTRPTRSGSSTV